LLRESSFSYAGHSIIRMAALLTRSLLSSFPIYGGHRPQWANAITQSLLTQISQQLPRSSNATTNNAGPSINAQKSLQPPRYRRVRELGLVCQPRVESYVRPQAPGSSQVGKSVKNAQNRPQICNFFAQKYAIRHKGVTRCNVMSHEVTRNVTRLREHSKGRS
jgi:hypothetical protein